MRRTRLSNGDERRVATSRRYLRFFGPRVEADVDDELGFHIDMLVHDLMVRGATEMEARAAARRRFGEVRPVEDACRTIGYRRQRRMTRSRSIEAVRQDIRFAVRMLVRQKAWTLVAVLTLGLGIGATTGIFSVVNTMILHPVPWANADRLYLVWQTDPKSGVLVGVGSELLDAWARAHAVDGMERYAQGSVTMTPPGGEPSEVNAAWIDPGLPALAGIPVRVGRGFTQEEGADSTARVVILGEGLWRERFAASPEIVGHVVSFGEKPFRVVGIMPARLRLPPIHQSGPTQVWFPGAPKNPSVAPSVFTQALVWLRPGVSSAQAERELAAIERTAPSQTTAERAFVPRLLPPGHFNGWSDSLALLSIAVTLLLVIACANVAHLVLARGAMRERELAIRRALGASRSRILRQLFTESTILSLAGCGTGLALAKLGLVLFVRLRPSSLDQIAYAELDHRVLSVAVAIACLTAIAFGMVAALHGTRHGGAESLRGGSGSGTSSRRSHRTRSTLIVTEMALSAMLLVGATLLVRSVMNLQQIQPGFDTSDLYSMKFSLPPRLLTDTAARGELIRRTLDGATRIPGVVSATIAGAAPPAASFRIGTLILEDGARPRGNELFNPMNTVRPDYFSVMRLPITSGRGFDARSGERDEVLVNAGFARKMWPGQSAIGKRFRFGPAPGNVDNTAEKWLTVVGVTGDAVFRGLSDDRHEPLIYVPSRTGATFAGFALIVRTVPGVAVAGPLRRLSLALDPSLAPPEVSSVEHALSQSIATQRFTMSVLAVFAVLALALAAVGLYGVISYMVAQRAREIGIRVALGATPRHIAGAVAGGGIALSLAGLALGLIASSWSTRLIQKTLYGVGPTDPMSFALGGIVLLGVATLACLVPTRRAARVDPLIAMRAE